MPKISTSTSIVVPAGQRLMIQGIGAILGTVLAPLIGARFGRRPPGPVRLRLV